MSAAPPRAPQILIVEDDPGNALVMKTILTRLGRMAVVVSEDGDQVLAWIEAGHIDAVVMDVSLSNTKVAGQATDGLELTRQIKGIAKRTGRTTKVLLATAHAMRGDGERFLKESGADGYVTKPIVDHASFVSHVRALLA